MNRYFEYLVISLILYNRAGTFPPKESTNIALFYTALLYNVIHISVAVKMVDRSKGLTQKVVLGSLVNPSLCGRYSPDQYDLYDTPHSLIWVNVHLMMRCYCRWCF